MHSRGWVSKNIVPMILSTPIFISQGMSQASENCLKRHQSPLDSLKKCCEVRKFTPENTLLLFNIAMKNDPFIEDFPIKTSILKGFSMAMLNNQMVKDLSE